MNATVEIVKSTHADVVDGTIGELVHSPTLPSEYAAVRITKSWHNPANENKIETRTIAVEKTNIKQL